MRQILSDAAAGLISAILFSKLMKVLKLMRTTSAITFFIIIIIPVLSHK